MPLFLHVIDLHTHSHCSDGSSSPQELIRLAASSGLTAIALTDHDTVAGIDEARAASRTYGIRFIPGVELEAAFKPSPGRLHILGLGLEDWHADLEARLITLRAERTERNQRIVEKMRRSGIDASLEDVARHAVGSVVGRPHFAAFLVERGLVSTTQDAFDRYLTPGKRFYSGRKSIEPAEALELIRAAGGRPVIAHPLTLRLSLPKLRRVLLEWREAGLEGIEALHSNTTLERAAELRTLADDLGLFVTGGSDYHGDYRPDRRLGFGAGGRPLDDALLTPFDSPKENRLL